MTIPKVEIAVDGKCPYCQVPVGRMEIHLCSGPGTDENESLRRMLSEAAREINCAGPVAHRIRILKKEHAAQLATAREEGRREVLADLLPKWQKHHEGVMCCDEKCFCWELETAFDEILPTEDTP